jgi:hypothetical protein
MTGEPLPAATSYEVALSGRIGPAYLAALASAGARRRGTTSDFLLPRSSGADVCEVVAMLQARGLVVLHVRRVGDLPVRSRTEEPREPGADPGSSAMGDAPEERHEGP